MRKQKALTWIAVFLGVLVLYCLMNHREGFVIKPAAHASHVSHPSHASHVSHPSHASHVSHPSHASHASQQMPAKISSQIGGSNTDDWRQTAKCWLQKLGGYQSWDCQ